MNKLKENLVKRPGVLWFPIDKEEAVHPRSQKLKEKKHWAANKYGA